MSKFEFIMLIIIGMLVGFYLGWLALNPFIGANVVLFNSLAATAIVTGFVIWIMLKQ